MSETAHVIDVFLQPGDYFAGDAGFRVRTLLGSCVSITLWHPRLRVGAMSHFLLPARPPGEGADGRFGDDALVLMLTELKAYGIRGGECQAKLFGGGAMFPARERAGPTIGQRNGESARALLARHGIKLVSASLYGTGYRQIMFDIASGDVWERQAGAAP